jgi:hypothetical protein
MLDAHEMKNIKRENQARLAAEFEAEYPDIVMVLEIKILESAKNGNGEVTVFIGQNADTLDRTEEYLYFKGYHAGRTSSGKLKTTYFEDGQIKCQESIRDSLIIRF